MLCPQCQKPLYSYLIDGYDAVKHRTLSRILWLGLEVKICHCGFRKISSLLIQFEGKAKLVFVIFSFTPLSLKVVTVKKR